MLRTLFAIAAHEDWDIDQMDVATAYLNSKLPDKEVLFMEMPQGTKNPPGTVCRLNKTLYGLKQSGRYWNITITDAILQKLSKLHFTRSEFDHCMFISRSGSNVVIIVIYVDDLLLFSNDRASLDKAKQLLTKEFDMKDLGTAKRYLGINITRDRKARTLKLNQSEYVKDILERYGMSSCNGATIPLDPSLPLQKSKDSDTRTDGTRYRQINGSLMFAGIHTRPDILFAVAKLSQFNNDPNDIHHAAQKHVLRYLKGTTDMSISYGQSDSPSPLKIVGYTDASWGDNLDDRRSTTGCTFTLNKGPISWEAKKQPTVALSTMEAEYMALCRAAKEAISLQRLFADIQGTEISTIIIYVDNQAAISHAKDPTDHARTKHIDIKYHFTREAFAKGMIDIEYISTEDMIADVLTKALPRIKHQKCIKAMGMGKVSEGEEGVCE